MRDTASAAVALIGDPVAHSISPAIHRAAFRTAGMPIDYLALRVGRNELLNAWAGLPARLIGLNVTRPLKEAIVPLLDVVAPEAAEAGSVNTVVLRDRVARGHSTDGAGFLAALRRMRTRPPRVATVLGTGGVARAVTYGLRRAGTSLFVSGRNVQAGRRLCAAVGATFVTLEPAAVSAVLDESDLLVNCTPVGMWPNAVASPLPPGSALHPGLIVFDLVYRPRRTRLVVDARDRGCQTIEGIEMLIEQAARSFELWTGHPAPLQVMRNAAYRALDGGPDRDLDQEAPGSRGRFAGPDAAKTTRARGSRF